MIYLWKQIYNILLVIQSLSSVTGEVLKLYTNEVKIKFKYINILTRSTSIYIHKNGIFAAVDDIMPTLSKLVVEYIIKM